MRKWRWCWKLLLALALIALAWFVWPTPYAYSTGYRGARVRTHRVTAVRQELVGGRWESFIPPGHMTLEEFIARYYPELDAKLGVVAHSILEGAPAGEASDQYPTLGADFLEAREAWQRERRR